MGRDRQRRSEARAEARTKDASGTAAQREASRWDRHAVVGISVALLVAYFPILGAGFTNWDDDRFIAKNPLFQGPVVDYVMAAVGRVQFQAYHPLHLLSYLPDRLLWPQNPAGFHALSLALFTLTLMLGYFLLRRSTTVIPSLVAVLLVGLHPLAVESVAWVVGRKDVLALLLVFATLFVEDGQPRTRGRMFSAWGLAILACLAKTSAVVLPVILFAWLRYGREISIRDALRRVLPFAVIALIFAIPVPFIWRANQMLHPSRPLPFVLDVMGTLGVYVGHVLAPVSLSPVYPTVVSWQVWAALFTVAALLAVVGFWRRLPQAARFAAVAFVGALLPVVNLTPLYYRFADRYVLLALGVLAWPLAKLVAWPAARKVVVLMAPIVLGLELAATMQLVPAWNDSLSLWQHASAAQPRAPYAFLKLGETLRGEKRFREAAAAYVRAGELEPGGIKGPAGLLRTVGEKAEAEGRIPPQTCEVWESVIAQPGFDARRMETLIATLDKSECRACAEAMLWLALRMFRQSDADLIAFANKELDRGRKDTAMIYLSEIRDPRVAGLSEVTRRLGEDSPSPQSSP